MPASDWLAALLRFGRSRSLDRVLLEANRLRDARSWVPAAEAYRRYLAVHAEHDGVWIQLGHSLKESGDAEGARAAYLKATELNPRSVDGFIQLAHLDKAMDRLPSAVASFGRALDIDPTCEDALRELVALGKGAVAASHTDVGFRRLAEAHAALEKLRRAARELEATLPSLQSLSSFPVSDFSLFRRRFGLGDPPEARELPGWAAVIVDDGVSDLMATLRSLANQAPWTGVHVLTSRQGVAADLAQRSNVGIAASVSVLESGAVLAVPGAAWLLFVKAGSVLAPGALKWIDWSVSEAACIALYADEEIVDQADGDAGATSRGYFKAAYDPELGGGVQGHALLAVQNSPETVRILSEASALQAIDRIESWAGGGGRIAHLPRVLSRRGDTQPLRGAVEVARTGVLAQRIAVIIPTRDGGANLQKGLEAVSALAAKPDHLELVVVDNGSVDPATCRYLDQLSASGKARVLRDPAPFNWSRLNNQAVRAGAADLLLFLNDDVELQSRGWDEQLRLHLSRKEVGAVGCKLLYPDGVIQHAGMVFGREGTAHEGRGDTTPEVRHRAHVRRTVAAVTGAFLACRREDFEAVGGFDEVALPIWFNDVDFCLKLRARGLRILYLPEICGIHLESATLRRTSAIERFRSIWTSSQAEMRERWGSGFTRDPGLNPHFVSTAVPFEAVTEPSTEEIAAHMQRVARANPWLVTPEAA